MPRSDSSSSEITRDSNNDDYDIIPVARSYNNRNWERVAGPYAQSLEITTCCTLDIPVLSYDDSSSTFILLSLSHSLPSQQAEVSRFLSQVTFGPTRSLIDSWDYSNDMEIEMSSFVHKQMDTSETPMTLHRSFFRASTDFSVRQESIIYTNDDGRVYFFSYRPKHPCKRYSRYRPFAFTNYDAYDTLSVSTYVGGSMKQLSVNGVPRTIVSSFQDRNGNIIPNGSYEICFGMEEVVNGYFGIRTPDSACFWSYNPPIDLPDRLLGAYSSTIRTISLPTLSSGFGTIDEILIADYEEIYFGLAHYLKNDVRNSDCKNVDPDGDYRYILGQLASGEQMWFGGHVELDENSLENPISDGGAAMTNIMDLLDLPISDNWKLGACPVSTKSFMNSKFISLASVCCCSMGFKIIFHFISFPS